MITMIENIMNFTLIITVNYGATESFQLHFTDDTEHIMKHLDHYFTHIRYHVLHGNYKKKFSLKGSPFL